jgi:kynurenine/2-aminoadipate aminotransferase
MPPLDAPADVDSMPGLYNLPKSLLSLDVDGRVLRFDTFSKVRLARPAVAREVSLVPRQAFGPGLRAGLVTAHQDIVDKMLLHHETTIGQPAGMSQVQARPLRARLAHQPPRPGPQVVLNKMLRQWGRAGLHEHLCRVQCENHRRRKLFLSLLDRHLTGLCTWTTPVGGMFVWIQFVGVDDAAPLVDELIHHKLGGRRRARPGGPDAAFFGRVLLIAGYHFSLAGTRTPSFRATFASATDEQMATAIQYACAPPAPPAPLSLPVRSPR